MKRYLLLISVALLSMMAVTTFTSCGDDVEENGYKEGAAPIVNGKRLVKINKQEIGYNADGQVVRITSRYNDGTIYDTSYSYELYRIIKKPTNEMFYLTNGRITSRNYRLYLADDYPSTDGIDTYEYNNKGYLTKVTRPASIADGLPETYDITWEDGNIQKIIMHTTDDTWIETVYKYSSYMNNIPSLFNVIPWMDYMLVWQGYFGKRCKNLPVSRVSTLYDMETGSREVYSIETNNYNYTIDNGIVTKVKEVVVSEDYYSYASETSTNKYEYKLEWQ